MENSISIDMPVFEHQHLCVNAFGHSITAPLHKYGPAVRSYYLIHFILSGRGEFFVNNTNYKLSAGQGFLIEPDYLTLYMADEKEPWEYIWIGFSGTDAASLITSMGLSQEQPIFRSTEKELLSQYVFDMIEHNQGSIEDTLNNLGCLYHFLSVIASSNRDIIPETDGNQYVDQAIAYIHNHIMESVSVTDIAHYVGLSRSYLSTIFKQHTNLSPLEYIQAARLSQARHLLESSTYSVASIACTCGYQRPESLIKIFRQHYGISPAAYRKQVLERIHSTERTLRED